MVRLQAVIVQEILEEVANRESEASLEVGDKDHPFIMFWRQHNLAGRKPACNASRDMSCVGDPVNVGRNNLRSLLARAARRRGRIILRRR
jgi:hypothetical protein